MSKKGFRIHTVEHREYFVPAPSLKEAIRIIEDADLDPKDESVEFLQFGDFEIIEKEVLDG